MWDFLPKGPLGPVPFSDPRVSSLCSAVWSEVADHATRAGDKTVRIAMTMFQADEEHASSEGSHWAFIPAADLLLIVGDGMIGITAHGVFTWQVLPTPIVPQSVNALVALALPTFAPPSATPQMPLNVAPAIYSAMPGQGRLNKGTSDDEKIFVGGLTPSTTLDMLIAYFSQYGKITDAVVMIDKATGKPRGFGFVVFETIAMVDAAMKDYQKHRVDGKWVEVKRATPQNLNPAERAAMMGGGGPLPSPMLPSPQDNEADMAANSQVPNNSGNASPPPQEFTAVPPPSFDNSSSQPSATGLTPVVVAGVGADENAARRMFAERPAYDEGTTYDPLAEA